MKTMTILIMLALLQGCAAYRNMTPAQRQEFGRQMYEAGQAIQRQEAYNEAQLPRTTTTTCRQNGSQVWCSSNTF